MHQTTTDEGLYPHAVDYSAMRKALSPILLLALLEGTGTAALTAVGLTLVFGVMPVVNVAHGEFLMLGAVVAWFVTATLSGHAVLGFIAALIMARG